MVNDNQPPKTYGDQNLTLEQIAAKSPAEQEQYAREEMSPQEIRDYYRDNAGAGVDDTGIFGGIHKVFAEMGAQQKANQVGGAAAKDASTANTEYVQGLQPSDADYQGEAHARMTEFVKENMDPGQVGQVSEAYYSLHKAFEEFATTLGAAVNKSHGEWEGNSAEEARGYFTSLQKWADGNAQNAGLASEMMYQQSQAATTAKNSMPEEVPFNWDSEMKKWGDNPFNIIGNIEKTVETYKASNEAHQNAANVMTKYDNELYGVASKQPVFAEPPKFGAGGGAEGKEIGGKIEGSIETGLGNTNSSGYSGGGGPGSPPPDGGGQGSPIPVGSGGAGGGSAPPTLGGGAVTGAGNLPINSGTRPTGFQPSNFTPTPANTGGNSGFGGMGGVPMGMGAGMGGGFGGGSEYNSKIGRGGGAGGFGPGGSGSAPGAGSGAGAAKPGGVGAAEAAAGRGAAGAARGGAGGMAGGMGAGAGKGQGGEDQEHQRPSFLVEGDPDEIFGNDERTAPPVIGE
ncbi:hypothetical protein [Amycolatopsis nigrescens]|uniref:hypothetical protein n=1 Tax=Amycolatopsis nigrescens TaxID=381445 RepID=UPI000362B2EA|nr:hypothetical protein [Amycolatopsis nigrescens]